MLEQYNDIMSILDIAEVLSIGRNRVYELLSSGDLKGFRIGRNWKIPKKAIQDYIMTQSRLKQP